MKVNCKKTARQIGRWFELSDQEQQAIIEHAQKCPTCSEALESIEQVLRSMDQSAVEYSQLTHSRSMPDLPEKLPIRFRLFPPAPSWGWAAVAVTMVIVLAWLGGNLLTTSDFHRSQSSLQPFHMPTMPSYMPSMASIPLSPGELSLRIIRLKREIGPSLRRNIGIPNRPQGRKPH
jgi:predicted Fe-S protein YdhL (DUF1289 family)